MATRKSGWPESIPGMTNTLTTEEQTIVIESIKSLNPAVPSGERAAKDPGCFEHLFGFLQLDRAVIVVLRNANIPSHMGPYKMVLHLPGTLKEVLNSSFEASGVPTVDNDGQALRYLQDVEGYHIVVHDPA